MSEQRPGQLNIAQTKYAFDAPAMAGFGERLADINALADNAGGVVWRLQADDGDATAVDIFLVTTSWLI